MQFGCGTRILRVISRAGRPCHLFKLHQYPGLGLIGNSALSYNLSLRSEFKL